MKLKALYSFLNHDLQTIEKELAITIQTDQPLLQKASMQLLQAGGKRIRPVFVLLAGKFGNYDINVMKNVAVSLELIHMASLVHDDVIDNSDLRRGLPTVKSEYDNRIAMYTGDYIFARSLEIMANISNPNVHKLVAKTIVEVCVGEIEQIKDQYNWEQHCRTYLRRIKRKTALLIAVSCQLGAMAADATEEIHKNLYMFGYYVGMAFQITDDILDFTGTEAELGKPAGSDLLNGNITLPVLYAMQDEKIKKEIESFHYDSPENLSYLLNLIKSSGGIEFSKKVSQQYIDKALIILERLPNNRAKKTFYNIAKFIGKRNF